MKTAKRVLAFVAKTLGLVLVFVCALVIAALVHLDTPVGRRLAAEITTSALSDLFRGKIVVRRVGAIGASGLEGIDADLLSEAGVHVAEVRGVSARADVPGLVGGILRSVLLGKQPMRITVDAITIDHAVLRLDRTKDAAGSESLMLAQVFESRTPPSPPDPKAGPGPTVTLRDIDLRHAWVYGSPTNGLDLDADVEPAKASFFLENGRIEIAAEAVRLQLRRALPGLDGSLGARGRLVLPRGDAPAKGPQAVFASVGELGHLPLTASGRYSSSNLRAELVVPPSPGALLSRIVPGLRLDGDVATRLEARGSLDAIEADASVRAGPGNVRAHAHARLDGSSHVDLGMQVSDVQLATFVAEAPASKLGLTLLAHADFPTGAGPRVDLHAVLDPSSHVANEKLPATRLAAVLGADGLARADVTVDEPGAETSAHIELPRALEADRGPLAFTTSTALDVARLSRVSLPVRADGRVTTRGTLDTGTRILHAAASGELARVGASGLTVRSLGLAVDAHGPIDGPTLRVTGNGRTARFGEYALGRFAFSADAHVGTPVTIREARFSANTKGETLRIEADEVVFGPNRLDVRGASLRGLGAPLEARVSRRGGDLHVEANGPDLDLGRFGRLVEVPGFSGHLAVSTDLTLRGNELEGRADVSLVDGRAPGIEKASAKLAASVYERHVSVDLDAALADVIDVRLVGHDVTLAGPALLPASWRNASGGGWLDVKGDLDRVAEVVDLHGASVAPTHGTARVQAGFMHSADTPFPSVALAFSTHALALVFAPDEALPAPPKKPPSARTLTGIDFSGEVRIDGATGFSALSARARDAKGDLVRADGKTHLPLEKLFENPAAGLEALYAEPMGLFVEAPERKLSDLPPELASALGDIGGRASATLSLEGTVRHPTLLARVHGENVRLAAARTASELDAELRYDGKEARVEATLAAKNAGSLRLGANGKADLAILLGGDRPTDLLAKIGPLDARLDFEGFSLDTLPQTAEGRVRGKLDGNVKLARYLEDASLELALDARDVSVSGAELPHATLRASAKDGRGTAEAKLTQTDGSLALAADVGLAWGARLVPELDKTRTLDTRLSAKAFRLATLGPFVASVLSELDGRLDAEAHVTADASGKNVKSEGYVAVRELGFVVPSLGQEYRDVGAKATFSPGGVVSITDISASDGAGRIRGTASARFRDLDFVGANAAFVIGKSAPLDVVVGGQSLGEAYGRFDVTARKSDRDGLSVVVDVPSLHVRLSETAGKSVQELTPREDVHVGVVREKRLVRVRLRRSRDESEPPADPSASLPVDLLVKLGSDVEVRRGAMVTVQLTGEPRVRIAEGKTDVSGQIQLVSGNLDLQGKKFAIEKGTVTFESDPSNPVVVATATWTAQDRTRIFADFVGPVKTGKVTLRSEPTRPQSEILQLVVFGTADGFNAAPTQGGVGGSTGTKAATALGGGALTQGLDSALDGLTGLQTQTRIDTTSSNNPRPELEVQISSAVSIRFAYVLGTPPISEPDKTLGSVIFRFAPNWSLSTTVGDRGKATLDTIWQYRY
jgi:translocation and assembly module TamB